MYIFRLTQTGFYKDGCGLNKQELVQQLSALKFSQLEIKYGVNKCSNFYSFGVTEHLFTPNSTFQNINFLMVNNPMVNDLVFCYYQDNFVFGKIVKISNIKSVTLVDLYDKKIYSINTGLFYIFFITKTFVKLFEKVNILQEILVLMVV